MLETKKELIMMVDDNPQIIRILGSIFDCNKYALAYASSGKQALDYMENEKPDLILLDVMMPELDGYEVCKIIKADKTLKEIPVIFVTANHDIDSIVQGFKVGGVDYICKPFNSVELIARIENHLEIKRSREEIKTLKGIIPICARCKCIREETGFWKQVEEYISSRTEAEFSHGLCEKCTEELYGEEEWFKK